MVFGQDKKYRHKRMIDVYFKVLKNRFACKEYQTIQVVWYLKNGRPMGISEDIYIVKEEQPNYSLIED